MDNSTDNRNHDETLYSVGEICRITGITRKTLFYYDRIGLLVPYGRTEPHQFKLYDRERLERLNCIIEYRRAGFRIAEIRALLDEVNCKTKFHSQILKLEVNPSQKNTGG